MSPKAHPGYRDDDAPEGVAPPSKTVKPVKRAEPLHSVAADFGRRALRTYSDGVELAVSKGWTHQAKFGEFCSLFRDEDGSWYVVDHTGTWGWKL